MEALNPADSLSDDEFRTRFSECRFAEKEWTHASHLRMAWLMLEEHPLEEAHILIRVGIIRLNASQGLVETPSRGYHETITRVWLILVGAARRAERGPDSRAFLALHSGALTREAPLRHYSRERLFSVSARARFIDPDLEPLPHG